MLDYNYCIYRERVVCHQHTVVCFTTSQDLYHFFADVKSVSCFSHDIPETPRSAWKVPLAKNPWLASGQIRAGAQKSLTMLIWNLSSAVICFETSSPQISIFFNQLSSIMFLRTLCFLYCLIPNFKKNVSPPLQDFNGFFCFCCDKNSPNKHCCNIW